MIIITGDTMTKKKIWTSPIFNMIGWDLTTWLVKRKKTAVTVVAGVLMYLITDSAVASIVAGGVIEALIAIGEYYFKEVDL
jgi:hypothetical protein